MLGQHLTHKDMKFVSKSWGYELWIVNNEKYCGKILFIKQGKHCSFHYHKIKDEVLYIQSGRIYFRHKDPDSSDNMIREMGPGEAYHVKPGLIHQMTAIEDTTILEFSTQHFDEDSYRIKEDQVFELTKDQ